MRRNHGSKRKWNNGFTLVEILLTVGILMVLMAVMAPNVIRARRSLAQTELDAKAEIIYLAAQNQMVKLRAEGNSGCYQAGAPGVESAGTREIGGKTVNVCYVSSQSSSTGASAKVMAAGVTEEELRSHDWIIVYAPKSSSILDVFYWEDGENVDYSDAGTRSDYENLVTREDRMAAGGRVGRYSGQNVTVTTGSSNQLEPVILVENGEKLTLTIRCRYPIKNDITEPSFRLTLSDGKGHTCTPALTRVPKDSTAGYSNYEARVVLDDLSSEGTRFVNRYGTNSAQLEANRLMAGNLTATVTVKSPNKMVREGTASETFNALFAEGSTEDTAVIRCGRHLQNLDKDSGVSSLVTSARQESNIDFLDTGKVGDWNSCYSASFFHGATSRSTANFNPIVTAGLKSYDGQGHWIQGLSVENAEDGGLFASLAAGSQVQDLILTAPWIRGGKRAGALTSILNEGSTVKKLTVTGASILADDAAGGLIGQATGSGSSLENCRVYLKSGDLDRKTDTDIWVGGKNSGGLVGMLLLNSSLSVSDSFASTVAGRVADKSADVSAGGLVGELGGGANLTLERSYADCYLYGSRTGGLVGETKNDDTSCWVNLTACYAAGFQDASSSTAGLVNGNVRNMDHCYTIASMEINDSSKKNEKFTVARVVVPSGAVSRVYYAQRGKSDKLTGIEPIGAKTSDNLYALLGAPFDTNVADVYPYGLRAGLDLTRYPFPKLSGLGHYGDWELETVKENVFGLSNGTMYNEVTRTDTQPEVQVRTRPTGSPAHSGAGFFLYGTAEKNDLASATITKIRVLDSNGVEQSVNQAGALYTVSFSNQISKDAAYEYKAGTLQYFGDGTVRNLTVEVTLEDPETKVLYTLRTLQDVLQTYVVTFLPNGGQGTMEPIYTQQEKISSPACLFTRPGYSFNGWKDTATGANWEGDCTHNPVLEAQWVQGSQGGFTYHLHFMDNGHNFWNANGQYVEYYVALQYEETHTLWGVGYSVDGKKLVGWNTSPDGTGTAYRLGQVVSKLTDVPWGRVYLYAQWEETHYQIQFDGSGQPGTMPSLHPRFTDQVTLPQPTFQHPEDLKFTGWFHPELNRVYQPGDTVEQLGQFEDQVVTLYAQWESQSGENEFYYHLHFMENGMNFGGEGATSYIGLKYHQPYQLWGKDYSYQGKKLLSWNTEENGTGTTYECGQVVRELGKKADDKVYLYARWRESEYTIAFDGNGQPGSMPPITVKYTQKVALPQSAFQPTPGWHFIGWKVGNNNWTNQPGYEVEKLSDRDGTVVTVHAQWERNKYSVIYDDNGNNFYMAPVSATYGEDFTLQDSFIHNGKQLVSWNTKADGSGKGYAPGQLVRDLTAEEGGEVRLYAQWKKVGGVRLSTQALPNGAPSYFSPTEVLGLTGLPAAYQVPSRPAAREDLEWKFEGWYTSNVMGQGVKLLDTAGKIVAQNVEGYTKDGKFSMEEDKTLYARWHQPGYVYVDALVDGEDNEYLIADQRLYGAGTVHYMSSAIENNLSAGTVEVKADWSNPVYDASGSQYQLYIDDNSQEQRWIFHYVKTENGLPFYELITKRNTAYLLCRRGDGVGMYLTKRELIQQDFPSNYEDRILWYYGTHNWWSNILADKLYINSRDTLQWDQSQNRFFVGSGMGQVYLYHLRQLYQFY